MGVQIIGALTQRELPERPHPAIAAVVHTTGSTDLAKIMAFYRDPKGLQPNDCIATDGTIYRIAWEDRIAYHCKIDPAEARLYQRGYAEWSTWIWKNERPEHVGDEWSGYRTWRDTWRAECQSPLDLVTGAHPNTVSHGIELQQPEKPTKDIFTDAQYDALARRLEDLHATIGLQLDRRHVLGHSDCSPMRRCTAAGPWDPGRAFNWNRVWDLLGIRARLALV